MKAFKVDVETDTVGTDETHIIVRETLQQAESDGWEIAKENTDSYAEDFDNEYLYEDTYCTVTEITDLEELEDAQGTIGGSPSVLSILLELKRDGFNPEWVKEAIEYRETELKVRTRIKLESKVTRIEQQIAELVKSLNETQELLDAT